MFFALSKYLWVFADPANLLLIGMVLGALLLMTGWRKTGRRLLVLLALFALFISTVPVAGWAQWVLENRFPSPVEMPSKVDGIIVAGGVLDPRRSRDRGQPALGGAVERLTTMVSLAHQYPQAKIIFSGGAGDPSSPELKEAHYIAPFIRDMGLNPDRVIFEDEARNTTENAQITLKLAQPKPGETWLLVTSAFHMPRAMGTFRQAGWDIQAYPVDFSTSPTFTWKFFFNFSSGLIQVSHMTHEIVGLVFYKLTGRSQAFFPKP